MLSGNGHGPRGLAAVAAWLGRHDETATALPGQVRGVLWTGVFGYLGAALFAAVALGVA